MRFVVGDRVACRVGPAEWARGAVVQLSYREETWPARRVAPYQILLDDGHLIFAPHDSDELIRAEATFEKSLYKAEKESEAETSYREDVCARYPRKNPALFEPSELPRFLSPPLRAALQSEDVNAALRTLWTEEARGLYSMPFFTSEFCELLLDETEHFELWCADAGVPLHRPNTMNNHGAILDDFGMQPMMDALMRKCVQPLALAAGYEDVIGGDALCTHHAFLVAYALGKDLDLKFHVDSSDVTLNVCLGRTFEGGGLFFRGVRCRKHQQTGCTTEDEHVRYHHKPGTAVLHRGHHRHGAHEITSGERCNLILWCRGDPERGSSEGANKDHACQKWCWMHDTAGPSGGQAE